MRQLTILSFLLVSQICFTQSTFNIYDDSVYQQLEKWGHDIKQFKKADSITVAAATELFGPNGGFDLIRFPLYCLSHNADASIKSSEVRYPRNIQALNNIATSGNTPDILISVKIKISDNGNLVNNNIWGSFLDTVTGMIKPDIYFRSFKALINKIKTETGFDVQYVAPICEKSDRIDSSAYITFVDSIKNEFPNILIVGSEKWQISSTEDYLDYDNGNVANKTDIYSTHNKNLGWTSTYVNRYSMDWNGETKGGGGLLMDLFMDLNQSFYAGKVRKVILWEDFHLSSSTTNLNNGRFRRKVIESSKKPLIKCDVTDSSGGVISFVHTDSSIQVIYVSEDSILTFQFVSDLDTSRLPAGVISHTKNSLTLRGTADLNDFGDFIVYFAPQSVSIAEVEKVQQYQVFPNPSQSIFTINRISGEPPLSMSIYSISGKLVDYQASLSNLEVISWDATNFPKGEYIVLLKGNKFNQTIKVIKN